MINESNDVISSYDFKALKVDFEDDILVITLNRPERLNAFNDDMRAEFNWIGPRLEANGNIRAIIFEGAGERAFCAGADISWFEQEWDTERFRIEYRWIHDFFDRLERIEVPVIAAVHGICACGGLELAMACDFRIAAEGTKFGFTEGNINLIPGSGGCSRLVKLVGPGWAKEMVLAGEFIDTERAMITGLVTRLAPYEELHEAAMALARKLTSKAPMAMGLAKAIMNACDDMDSSSGRILERIGQSVLIKSDDHGEGIRAFREKRKPVYEGK
ncbi:MAG: enoyl-CoA hydratase/isomerase family protein [Rhodospirillales bacterium]|nr:enoyl-CoA hydratase/isomerase family protein [Rhodospirillales bacterium]